jgi:hypothetical protein
MERSCNLLGCPVDCEVEEWTGWSECSAECGGGVETRMRETRVEPKNDGEPCPVRTETRPCDGQACKKDCELSEWSAWGLCSKLCDTGYEERTKSVIEEAVGQGHCDAPDSEKRLQTRECNTMDCQSIIPAGRTTLKCNAMVDLIILLDGSGSLGWYGWTESKKMLLNYIEAMNGGPSGVNIGLLLFSGPYTWEQLEKCVSNNPNDVPRPEDCGMHWVKHLTEDIEAVEMAAQELKWPGGSTLTSMALEEARSELINGRQDAQSVVVVITDGKPLFRTSTKQASAAVKEEARLIWVPVGTGVKSSVEQMKEWASQPWENNLLEVDTFASLDTPSTINQMISEFCTELG